jgi:type I restriction enzyme S subunit
VAAIFNNVSRKCVSYVGNPKLMNNVVAGIEIFMPSSVEEQTAIAAVLFDMDADIAAQEARRQDPSPQAGYDPTTINRQH